MPSSRTPLADVLELAVHTVRALDAARRTGIPVLPSRAPSADMDTPIAAAESVGFPLVVKVVAGGGGRGMCRVRSPGDLPTEIAPAPGLGPGPVRRSVPRCGRVRPQHRVPERGTVEFLVDTVGGRAGTRVFIEMTPRIQVEHTVTDEVTDMDLVPSQMRIAAGESLAHLGINQESIRVNGVALQTRITTEVASNGFRPDSARIIAYRSPGCAGMRLDGATASAGSGPTSRSCTPSSPIRSSSQVTSRQVSSANAPSSSRHGRVPTGAPACVATSPT